MKTKNHKATITQYYDMQQTQDELYKMSLKGQVFTQLMDKIRSPENIKLAYRAIKKNSGSHTFGTDKKNIEHLAQMSEEEYVKFIQSLMENYHPKKVKRVEIPKPNGKTRPLGIPCIQDRIIQQCILQILEPICEAKFCEESYGFRPNRSAENAIAEVERLVQRSQMQYVVDFDIKGFFDNVNHRKLMRQLWTLGIRDTKLHQIIKQMLKAPIQMLDKSIVHPSKGTPQGGILSPLLANVVLNELDWWISSQWQNQWQNMKKPPKRQYSKRNGHRNLGNEYKALRKTKLKEMYIVRYADDFKIFCRTRQDAIKIKMAVTDWISHRLKLQVSEEKTSITNLKRNYSEFLGFKFKMQTKGKKQVINAQMSNKAVRAAKSKLKDQIKLIQKPKDEAELYKRVNVYNSMVMGIHNYYGIANNVCINLSSIQRNVSTVIKNRLTTAKQGEIKNSYLAKRYGKSKQVRWISGISIMPIGYCKSRNPMHKKSSINQYTPEGRKELYEKPYGVLEKVLHFIMRNPVKGRSIEYNDNRISLYMGQQGKCAITNEVLEIGKMHCHHIKPIHMGGTDEYKNLIFITDKVHKLIHATDENTVSKHLEIMPLDEKQLKELNKLRVQAGNKQIELKM